MRDRRSAKGAAAASKRSTSPTHGVRSARPNDAYGARAKRDGFAARSVYKLEEIDQRIRLFSRGKAVLDLGASPGSWTQYAANAVGPKGRVVAIDQQEFRATFPPWVEAFVADVLTYEPTEEFDIVISDMAPWTMGDRFTDQVRSFELFSAAHRIAAKSLRPRGAFVGKIFQGPDFEEARARLRKDFDEVRVIKPKGSRSESYEIFLVGLGRKPS